MSAACDDAPVTSEPEATTVEWGVSDRRPARFETLAGVRWRPSLLWALAGVGALAGFGSLVGEWLVIFPPEGFGPPDGDRRQALGPGQLAGWGAWWILSATVLSIVVALTLFGQPAIRAYTRTVGLATAGVLAAVLVAATTGLSGMSPYQSFVFDDEYDYHTGRGLHLAFVFLALLGAALWLARPGSDAARAPTDDPTDDPDGGPQADDRRRSGHRRWWRAGPERAERADAVHDGPHDLSVGPAEPDTLQG